MCPNAASVSAAIFVTFGDDLSLQGKVLSAPQMFVFCKRQICHSLDRAAEPPRYLPL